MRFSVGVEYAIHCLMNMVSLEDNKSIGVRDMANFQGISESYLSKTFARLTKAGLLKSSPGIRGGYSLGRHPDNISFWDVIRAIEGSEPFFQCQEIWHESAIQYHATADLPRESKSPCLINEIMNQAENEMKAYLSKITISWLYHQVYERKFTEEEREKTISWFRSHSW